MSALHGGVIPAASPSSTESALFQLGQISHPLVFLSSSLTMAHSSISQFTPVLEADVTTSSGVRSSYVNTRDLAGSLP